MKRILFGFIILILIIGISACTRSKSPSNDPYSKGQVEGTPSDGTENDVLNELAVFVTQTYEASMGTVIPFETSVPPLETTTEGEVATATLEGQVIEATSEQPTEIVQPTQAPAELVQWKPTPGIPETYVLQSGESPWCIARRFDIDPIDLLTTNGLSTNSIFKPGLVLRIPQNGNEFPDGRALLSHPDTYTVSSGDTIYKIACLYGDVDPNGIIAVNGLTDPYNLKAGQTLQIP
jgi:LysM repeat protein